MIESPTQNSDHMIVLKELSDIKTNLAVNTNETANLKSTLVDIKVSVGQIQADFVSRREFNDRMTTVEEQISPMKKVMYGLMSAIGLAILGELLNLIFIK